MSVFYQTEKVDPAIEPQLVVQALRINTMSKLTFADSIRFDGLVRDVFPGVQFKDIDYPTLEQAFREVCKENNLITNDTQVIHLHHILIHEEPLIANTIHTSL